MKVPVAEIRILRCSERALVMEVTEAPPAMMEVDSTILERVDKVGATKFKVVQGLKSDLQVEKVATNDEAQYQPPSELEAGQVSFKLFTNTSSNTK